MENTRGKIAFIEGILNSFPAAFKQDVEKMIGILPLEKEYLISPDSQTYYLDKEVIAIPSRLYVDEPDPLNETNLSDQQKMILNCIFLRHDNGYIRQKRLESLIDKTEYFIVPFVFQLLGEYVIEILFVLDRHINDNTIDDYVKFIGQNEKYWSKTQRRVISYWDAYYRRNHYQSPRPWRCKNIKDYIGQKIINRLKQAASGR